MMRRKIRKFNITKVISVGLIIATPLAAASFLSTNSVNEHNATNIVSNKPMVTPVPVDVEILPSDFFGSYWNERYWVGESIDGFARTIIISYEDPHWEDNEDIDFLYRVNENKEDVSGISPFTQYTKEFNQYIINGGDTFTNDYYEVVENNPNGFTFIEGDWNFIASLSYLWGFSLWNLEKGSNIIVNEPLNFMIGAEFIFEGIYYGLSSYYNEFNNSSSEHIEDLVISDILLKNILFGEYYEKSNGTWKNSTQIQYEFHEETPIGYPPKQNNTSKHWTHYMKNPSNIVTTQEEVAQNYDGSSFLEEVSNFNKINQNNFVIQDTSTLEELFIFVSGLTLYKLNETFVKQNDMEELVNSIKNENSIGYQDQPIFSNEDIEISFTLENKEGVVEYDDTMKEISLNEFDNIEVTINILETPQSFSKEMVFNIDPSFLKIDSGNDDKLVVFNFIVVITVFVIFIVIIFMVGKSFLKKRKMNNIY